MRSGSFGKFIQKCSWLIISMLLLTGILGTINQNNGRQNLYTYQAEAFLQGNFAIQEKQGKLPGETIEHQGRIYIPFPPFPAVLLTPVVAIFGGENIKIYWISFFMAALTCLLLYRILSNLDIDKKITAWMLAAFAMGTGYWQVFRASEWVWMFAQLTAVLFAVLSIHETMQGGKGWLAGLFLTMAFLSRQLSIYLVFFILALLWTNPRKADKVWNLAGFFISVGFGLLVYLGFNYYRFGTIGTGYEALNYDTYGGPENLLWARVSQHGIFSPAYFIFNSVYMFIQGYHIQFGGADMLEFSGVDRFGTSLLAASPFVIAALRAKGDQLLLWGGWTAVLFPLFHGLFYHNNGYIQYNSQRFTMDFMPVLIILSALGFKNSSQDLRYYWMGMIAYSIFLNLITNYLPFY